MYKRAKMFSLIPWALDVSRKDLADGSYSDLFNGVKQKYTVKNKNVISKELESGEKVVYSDFRRSKNYLIPKNISLVVQNGYEISIYLVEPKLDEVVSLSFRPSKDMLEKYKVLSLSGVEIK